MTGRRSSAVQTGVDLARSGQTIRAAAKQAGCHYTSIARVLRAAGDPRRKPGRPKVATGDSQ